MNVVLQSCALQPHEADAGWHTEYREDLPAKAPKEGGKGQPREKQGRCRLEYLYLYNTNSVCVCVCLSSIGGQTAGPIMTTFGTHMRIDLGMVPTKYWPHEWPGSVGSLGPISESGLSCQLLLRAVVWQMTSQ